MNMGFIVRNCPDDADGYCMDPDGVFYFKGDFICLDNNWSKIKERSKSVKSIPDIKEFKKIKTANELFSEFYEIPLKDRINKTSHDYIYDYMNEKIDKVLVHLEERFDEFENIEEVLELMDEIKELLK